MRFFTKSLGRFLTISGGTMHTSEITVDTAKLAQMKLFKENNGYPAQLLLKFHSCCTAESNVNDNDVRLYHHNSKELAKLRHKIQLVSKNL